jgi:hypothetical protein
VQDQIAKVVEDIQNVLNRFPEFDEISLAMITVQYATDEGETIAAREASLLARQGGSDWLTYEESAEVHTMNSMVDWSRETRELLDKIGLRASAIVFSREDAQTDAIAEKFVERLQWRSASAMSVGM